MSWYTQSKHFCSLMKLVNKKAELTQNAKYSSTWSNPACFHFQQVPYLLIVYCPYSMSCLRELQDLWSVKQTHDITLINSNTKCWLELYIKMDSALQMNLPRGHTTLFQKCLTVDQEHSGPTDHCIHNHGLLNNGACSLRYRQKMIVVNIRWENSTNVF